MKTLNLISEGEDNASFSEDITVLGDKNQNKDNAHHDIQPLNVSTLANEALCDENLFVNQCGEGFIEQSLGSEPFEGRPAERSGEAAVLGRIKTGKFTAYCASQKGHDLTIALCSVLVLILTMIGVAVLFSHVFGASTIDSSTLKLFFLTLYGISIAVTWILLLLASAKKLTNDRQYRDQSETNFLRGGIICLGTGGILYYAVSGTSVALEPSHCLDLSEIIHPVVAIVFTCSEMTFILKYSKIRINKNLWTSVISRFMIVLVIATNLCVWVKTVVLESQEEINYEKNASTDRSDLNHDINATDHPQKEWLNSSDADPCKYADELRHQIQPYTWPLLIEFCVVSSTGLMAIWENCGHGLEVKTGEPRRPRQYHDSCTSMASSDADFMAVDGASSSWSIPPPFRLETRTSSDQKKIRYYNSNLGFLAGWVMVIISMVLIILYLYVVATRATPDGYEMEMAVYSTNMAISAVCLITVPITMVKMSSLSFRDDEMQKIKDAMSGMRNSGARLSKRGNLQRVIDRQLLGATNLAHMAFHVMSMIAAVESKTAIIFANSLVSVIMVCVQTVFINWYAMQKRATTEEHLQEKPGRQALEFLRFGNLALWLTNTFLVKHPNAKRVHNTTFGVVTWAVVSNICQPLLILYHFHALCCIAEVINHSYTEEYIGVIRPMKLSRHSPENTTDFEDRPANDKFVENEI